MALHILQARNTYGTTIRVYDPPTGRWRITWINPVTGAHNELIGRRQGSEIVQEGVGAKGALTRWRFVDIRPDAFHWLGESSRDGGKTWTLETELSRAARAPGRFVEWPFG